MHRKLNITRGELEDLYVNQLLSQQKIANSLGVSRTAVENLIHKFEIARTLGQERLAGFVNPSGRKPMLDSVEIKYLHSLGISIQNIADLMGCSSRAVRHIIRGRIKIRKTDESYTPRAERTKRVSDTGLSRAESVASIPCKSCGRIRNIKWTGTASVEKAASKLCRSCSQKNPVGFVSKRKRIQSEIACPDCGTVRLAYHRAGITPRCPKCSRRHILETIWKGDKHPRWKGGVTKQYHAQRTNLRYRQWQDACLKRDGYTCQICGVKKAKKKSFHVHHIKLFSEFPDLRYEVSNGVSLCKLCHEEIVHRGKQSTNPIPWEEIKLMLDTGVLSVDWKEAA